MQATFNPEAINFLPSLTLNPQATCFRPNSYFNAEVPSFKPASKLDPEALSFEPTSRLSPAALSFEPASKLDPEARFFKPTVKLNHAAPSFEPASKLDPETPCFEPTTKLNSAAPSFKPTSTMNPEAACFKPKSQLSPRAAVYKHAHKFNPQALFFKPNSKLNAEAACFEPKSRLNPAARSFLPISRLNPEAEIFEPSTQLDPRAQSFQPTSKLDAEAPDSVSETRSDADAATPSASLPSINTDYTSAARSDTNDENKDNFEVDTAPERGSGSDTALQGEPGNPDEDVHHYNWLGHPVEHKSFTKPATSLAIIMSKPKLLVGRFDDLDDHDLHKQLVLLRAMYFIDPVVFTGQRDTLQLKGTALENAVIGQTDKFYSGYGWWHDDSYGLDEDVPHWDPLDENAYNLTDVVMNGIYDDGNVLLPDEYRQYAMEADSSQRQRRSASKRKEHEQGIGKSPLSQVWNISDLDCFDQTLANWGDEFDEVDSSVVSVRDEMQRIRKNLRISTDALIKDNAITEVDEDLLPLFFSGYSSSVEGTRSPLSSETGSEDREPTTPTSTSMTGEFDLPQQLVKDSVELVDKDAVDATQLLAFMGGNLLEFSDLDNIGNQPDSANIPPVMDESASTTDNEEQLDKAANINELESNKDFTSDDDALLLSSTPAAPPVAGVVTIVSEDKAARVTNLPSLSCSIDQLKGGEADTVTDDLVQQKFLPASSTSATEEGRKTSYSAGSTSLRGLAYVLPLGKMAFSPTSTPLPALLTLLQAHGSRGINVKTPVYSPHLASQSLKMASSPLALNPQAQRMFDGFSEWHEPAMTQLDGNDEAAGQHEAEEVRRKAEQDKEAADNGSKQDKPGPATPTTRRACAVSVDSRDMSFTDALNITPPWVAGRRDRDADTSTSGSYDPRPVIIAPPSAFSSVRATAGSPPPSVGITPTTASGIIERLRDSTRRRCRVDSTRPSRRRSASAARQGDGVAVGESASTSASWRVRYQILGDGTSSAVNGEGRQRNEGLLKKAWRGFTGFFGHEINILTR